MYGQRTRPDEVRMPDIELKSHSGGCLSMTLEFQHRLSLPYVFGSEGECASSLSARTAVSGVVERGKGAA